MLRKKGRRGGGGTDKFCELGFVSLSVYAHGNRLFFLAVQDSSIVDLVTHSVNDSSFDFSVFRAVQGHEK